MSDETVIETEVSEPIGDAEGRKLVVQVLPSKQSMGTPSPFAHFVRAVATKDHATLFFLQQPFDERDDILAQVVAAVKQDPNGTGPVVVPRRVEPVAKVLMPLSVLKDLRSVIDRVVESVEKGPRHETISVTADNATEKPNA